MPGSQEIVTYFEVTPIDEILNTDLKDFSFEPFRRSSVSTIQMLVDSLKVLEDGSTITPPVVSISIRIYSEHIYEHFIKMKSFTVGVDLTDATQRRNSIILEFDKLQKLLTNGINVGAEVNFFTAYSTAINLKYASALPDLTNVTQFNELKAEVLEQTAPVADRKIELDELSSKVSDSLQKVVEASQKQVTQRYAKMFEEQAKKHKSNASVWLIVAITGVALLLGFIKTEDFWLPIDDKASATIITIESVKRILVVSFIIYIVGLCFKQYGIQKHLETQNTHRQNTLSSFELFIQSVGSAEDDVRHTLMVEIARAIYDAGQTGYIGNKDDGGGTASIMEITKYLKPDK